MFVLCAIFSLLVFPSVALSLGVSEGYFILEDHRFDLTMCMRRPHPAYSPPGLVSFSTLDVSSLIFCHLPLHMPLASAFWRYTAFFSENNERAKRNYIARPGVSSGGGHGRFYWWVQVRQAGR